MTVFFRSKGVSVLLLLFKKLLFLRYKYLCMDFTDKEMAAMRLFYEDERTRYSAHLRHIDKMLTKLRGKKLEIDNGVLMTKTGVKAKKRGPKSIWGKFILDQLEEAGGPMSYKMLVNKALEFKNLDFNSAGIVRASILNSAFRLRSIHGKITTVGQLGKKEKFLILASWLDETGMMSQKHQDMLVEIAGGAPERVDTSELPKPRYDEDLKPL